MTAITESFPRKTIRLPWGGRALTGPAGRQTAASGIAAITSTAKSLRVIFSERTAAFGVSLAAWPGSTLVCFKAQDAWRLRALALGSQRDLWTL
ncbi:MAG: hypothetical protein ACRD2P_04265 [Terriglobia bacterium]